MVWYLEVACWFCWAELQCASPGGRHSSVVLWLRFREHTSMLNLGEKEDISASIWKLGVGTPISRPLVLPSVVYLQKTMNPHSVLPHWVLFGPVSAAQMENCRRGEEKRGSLMVFSNSTPIHSILQWPLYNPGKFTFIWQEENISPPVVIESWD